MVFMNWMTCSEDCITLTLACPFENTTNNHSLTATIPPNFFLIDFQNSEGCWRCSSAHGHTQREKLETLKIISCIF